MVQKIIVYRHPKTENKMKILSIDKSNINFITILEEMEKTGENVLIYRNGKPLANLSLHVKKDRLKLHPVMSKIKIKYDPTEPLDLDEWQEDDS